MTNNIRRLIVILSVCLVLAIITIVFIIKNSISKTHNVEVPPILTPSQTVSPTKEVTPTSTPSATATPTIKPTAKPTIKLNIIPRLKVTIMPTVKPTSIPVDLNLKPIEKKINIPGL